MSRILKSIIVIVALQWQTAFAENIKDFFHQSRQALHQKIRNINKCSLPMDTEEKIKNFILDQKDVIAGDLMQSKHVWDAIPDQQFCALTYAIPSSDIYLSAQSCKDMSKNINSIYRLLIHESIHHIAKIDHNAGKERKFEFFLGFEIEEFADLVAVAINESRVIPCWNDHNSNEKIETLNGRTCHLQQGHLNCKEISTNNEILFPSVLKSPYDFTLTETNICALDQNGLTCLHDDPLIDVVEKMSTDELISLHGGVYPCIRTREGLYCSKEMYEGPEDKVQIDFIFLRTLTPITYNFLDYRGAFVNDNEAVAELYYPYSMSSSERFACVIDLKGIACWSNYGYLQDSKIRRVKENIAAVQIAVSDFGLCAIDQNNEITCWKFNSYRQPVLSLPKTIHTGASKQSLISLSGYDLCYTIDNNIECIKHYF